MKTERAISLFLAVLLFAAGAAADVHYQSETQVQFSGSLGTMMKLFGGSKPVTSTVSLKGNVLRTDFENGAQIIDLDRSVFVDLDHKKKQYMEMTFEQMKQRLQVAANQLQKKTAGEDPNHPSDGVQVHFKATVQPTGNKQTLDGHETESIVVTLTVEGQDSTGAAGSMLTTSEMWMAKDLSGYSEMQDFRQRLVAKFGSDVLGGAKLIDALARTAPDLAVALRELEKEAHQVEGIPLLTTMRIDAAATPSPDAAAGGNGAQVGAKDEGIKVEKPSIGGMLGRLGKKKLEERQQKKAAEQATNGGRVNLVTSSTHMSGFSTATLGSSVFEIPATYTKVEPKE